MVTKLFSICLLVAVAIPATALDLPAGASITGDYLESRSAEVVVGHCLANAESGLAGREAILAWTVRAGAWNGEPLAGLSVVAVVQSPDTIGDIVSEPVPARAVLVVDERASQPQREALIGLAQSMAPSLLADVVGIESAPIEVAAAAGLRSVRAGDLAAVEVRERRHADGLCGNEGVFYPPLIALEHAHPTYTLVHEWQGAGLEGTWKSPEKSSSFTGTFVR
ncbi:MAG TPA: DUF1326 domain-containing protein [Thermoanaerobaculia bacterium]|jgi:hypothetical protein|nr:DUF1326 domain-containing protein [Thermoanaerobaculia bacterium]